MRFRRRALVFALLAAAALPGCGGVGVHMFDRAEPTNDTDAAFVRAMIAHEKGTASIAELGREKCLRDELRGIARDTLTRYDRNAPDLSLFESALRGRPQSLLRSYIRQKPPRVDTRGLRHAVSFDHEFLVRMIEQHQYAVTTSAMEREHGGDPRLRALAKSMHDSSKRDLDKLKYWLRTWYGDDTQRGPGTTPGGGGGSGGGGGGGGGGNGPGGGSGPPPDV